MIPLWCQQISALGSVDSGEEIRAQKVNSEEEAVLFAPREPPRDAAICLRCGATWRT